MLRGKFAYYECANCGDVYGELSGPCSKCGSIGKVATMYEFEAIVSIPSGVESRAESMEEDEFLHLLREFIATQGDSLVDAKVHRAPSLVEAVLNRLDEYLEEAEHQGELDPAHIADNMVRAVGRDFGTHLSLEESWERLSPPELTIACICGRAVTLAIRGGQYQYLYQGECSCGRSWNLEEVAEVNSSIGG